MNRKIISLDYSISQDGVACPYCGHNNYINFEKGKTYEIIYCEGEEGGCDERFIVSHSINIEIKHTALKIEGEGDVERDND